MSDRLDILKVGADKYAQYYADIRRILSEDYAANVRWITASLFALNAGGLVSFAGKTKLNITQQYAGYAFYAGIFLAFGYVIYSQIKSKKFLGTIQHIENCWVDCAASGQLDEQRLSKLEKEKSRTSTKLAIVFPIGSFAMFSFGMGLFASSL